MMISFDPVLVCVVCPSVIYFSSIKQVQKAIQAAWMAFYNFRRLYSKRVVNAKLLPVSEDDLTSAYFQESLINASVRLEVYKTKLAGSKIDRMWFLPTLQQKEALASSMHNLKPFTHLWMEMAGLAGY